MLAAWLAPAFGGLVGIVLALTGAGGAVLAVPLLVFGLHLGVAQAGPVGLLAVMLAASLGALLGLRARQLRYKAAGLMALAGALVSPPGLWLAQRLPDRPLGALFALVLLAVAVRMFRQAQRDLRGDSPVTAARGPCRLDPASGKLHWNWACARALLLFGGAAGFLSGLLGVGGGFILVPALLAMSDLPMKAVTATSMGVVALVSLVGVFNAGLTGHMDWAIAWPFAAGAVAGMAVGRLFAARLAGPRLQQGFAALSLLVAASLLVRAVA